MCGVGPEEFVPEESVGTKASAAVAKRWKCTVCGYIHEGDQPPETCPVCGVGPEEFVPDESVKAETPVTMVAGKRWKCTVCDYIHEGDAPPDKCPLCGVGPEQFILLEDSRQPLTAEAILDAGEGTAAAALDTISYGLYIVTSIDGDKMNGQCANTIFQLTSRPLQVALCLNKRNLTHDFIKTSQRFAINILRQDQCELVKDFGYRSGRSVDKFAGVDYLLGKNGCPILKDCVAYLEGTIQPEKSNDVGTHTLFVASITAGRLVNQEAPLTYSFYRSQKNG
ncbi:MAG TPA: flavin reductase [Patescibacteria group bacterium]|nr:flavin reductase [Patescibacteria group bacterium]